MHIDGPWSWSHSHVSPRTSDLLAWLDMLAVSHLSMWMLYQVLCGILVTKLLFAWVLDLLDTEICVYDSWCRFIQLLDWRYVTIDLIPINKLWVGFTFTTDGIFSLVGWLLMMRVIDSWPGWLQMRLWLALCLLLLFLPFCFNRLYDQLSSPHLLNQSWRQSFKPFQTRVHSLDLFIKLIGLQWS